MRRILPSAVALCLAVVTADPLAAELRIPGEAKLLSGDDIKSMILMDFTRFDPEYLENRERLGGRLDGLGRRLADLQAAGHEMECSNEIYLEAIWLRRYTANWNGLESRLVDLAKSLEQLDQRFAARQSPETGLWGACYERSFFKLEATTLALIQLAAMDEAPRYAVHLPHPFETRAAAFAHFRGLLVSDVAHTGVDNRGELGNIATIASLVRFKDYIQRYLDTKVLGLPRNEGGPGARAEEYRREFSRYVDAWQDPITGYWGPWYLSRSQLYKTTDLSLTFHIISYKRGQVDRWPEIIATTLAIEDDPYPFGWKHEGELTNHNNYDVAKILRYGWPQMSLEQKRQAASAIGEMLHWTLMSSLQANGSFKSIPTFFSSVSADFYFGVSFLKTIGYWDPANRFWTERNFPDAGAVCERVKARLVATALKSHESESALNHLKESC
jgi:hypothetical protein